MRSESISTAKNNLSALVKEVQSGESVLITDRGVPVARLVPVRMGKGMPARALGLAQQGLLRLPDRTPDARWTALPIPKLPRGIAGAAAVVAERRGESR